jgi:hypothetical protein
MTVPPYKQFIQPIMRYLAQHDEPVLAGEAYEAAARDLCLTEGARGEQLTSGGAVYKNRAAWGLNWLKRAGLAEAPSPGTWRLTALGKEVAASPMTTTELLSRFDATVTGRALQSATARPSAIVSRRSRSAEATIGNRKAYRLPAKPLQIGGQAEVYRAVRKADNTEVIFKRSRNRFGPNRMKREIEVQSSLRHVNVMPILDWDTVDHSWYVMPLGSRTMADLKRPIEEALLLRIVCSVISALDAAHSVGHPHRDVKPQNVIELADGSDVSRWVLADWGLTRRPPGFTTAEWTETGQLLGSEGFAPPEAYRDAHNVGVPGDVYALGQLIAWATGVNPVPNVSPIVRAPWKQLVEFMTQQEASRRPQSMSDVRQLLPRRCDSEPSAETGE